ncbi:SDR family NAD(P)-dependent oxidoreductase [Actinokineospora sp. G85]|uniref:SDR family NAD(P)-dependent oxidoreductase n=1 Tax=Actinokineospora sp. G85 TaxID=3406626 RepID=UPI003C76F8F3
MNPQSSAKEERLDAARDKLGANALAVRGDVASLEDLASLAEQVLAELGSLDALFVDAGITRTAPLEEMTEKAYDEVFDINVKGAYFIAQRVAENPSRVPGASVAACAIDTPLLSESGLPEDGPVRTPVGLHGQRAVPCVWGVRTG